MGIPELKDNTTNNSNNKVVGISNREAGSSILMLLEERRRSSENTYKNYLRYYSELFMFVSNKTISELTWEDIFKVDYRNILEYKMYLLDKGNSPNSTNQKLFAGRGLWKQLYTLNQNVKLKVFDFKEEKVEVITYASFSAKEMELLFDYMDKEKYKPLTKKLFFEFLYIVGCRKSVALNLEWSNFTLQRDHSNNLDVWVIKYFDKGQQIEKAINDDFYEKLLELKLKDSLGEKVFDLNKDTFETVFKQFQEAHKLHEKGGKILCIHSIKKASGWLVQNTFGDINKTRKHLQHKSVNTTAKIYLGAENYSEQASYLIGRDINVNFLKELDKNELINLIEKCGKETIMKLYYENEKKRG